MFELQHFIFDKIPTRRELLDYTTTSSQNVKICVYRNHSFELIEHTIGAFLDFSKIKGDFSYSDYDDSLSFINLDYESDLLILWIDLARYKIDKKDEFIKNRITELRKVYFKPILLVVINGKVDIDNKLAIIVDLSKIEEELGEKFFDERMEKFTGTSLSSQALLRISKLIGLKYIPFCLNFSIKGIICDLDNTLYKGVIGEDGIDGIVLTESYKLLQKALMQKKEEGLFLCIASKNNYDDVLKLLDSRKDFPIRKEDFTVIESAWYEKTQMIENIKKKLNIGYDALLFIDDNVGELAKVKAMMPTIKLLHASDDASITKATLDYYPGLLKINHLSEDMLRGQDIVANQERFKMKETMSQEDYIKSLAMKVTFTINDKSQIRRIAELSNKTNQFIFNYKRYSELQIEQLMDNNDSFVITTTLSDKLSDSGIIGVCAGKKGNNCIIIEECFVSCRALGRGIDDILVLGMIDIAEKKYGVKKVKVEFKKGERNEPAELFIKKYLVNNLDQESIITHIIDTSLVDMVINI